ncbi:DUF885 domain-containing protein [Robiginitomaculum antarcticum]|uniref:DUF885 domain-containing protein n=1 Tax=Robiginitomaculum antarcticum TaxID=437507 RepID=UPI000375B492|nr:DUF885 domain-containing protein [Robiginitomaculum antarcticum]
MRKILISSVSILILAACQPSGTPVSPDANVTVPAEQVSAAQIAQNDQAINAFFETKFEEGLMRSPMSQTYLGIRTMPDYGKWDDASEANEERELEFTKETLADMRETFDPENLSEGAALSYRLMEEQLEDEIAGYKWRNHGYSFNQMFGPHSGIPAMLINQHIVTTEEHAQAYISRIKAIPDYLGTIVDRTNARAEMGVQPPAFVYDLLQSDVANLLKGAPFTNGPDHSLLADFKKKVAALDLPQARKDELIEEARQALLDDFQPAYVKLQASLKEQAKTATVDDGAWKLPEGDDYYSYRLKRITTTDMTADEIHNLGLSETKRIHDEMREIMKSVGFEGTLQEFFVYMRTDPDSKFTYPNTADGKQTYLTEAKRLIDVMEGRLDDVFLTKPKARMIVKAVEPFREKTAGKAFYDRPAPDGSKPGTYYANLYDTSQMPTYQMEALAYHEGIPGHHMQIAIAQELEGVPKFRKFGGYTAYTEGWGLYSEFLPKEMGFYQDPYSDFGRLAMELWRAGRLVVDTGLHDKQWTRQQAIDWLSENTPNPQGDIDKAIERYIVMPGQATAYKIGMIKIVELREEAKAELGEAFDIREFHDVVLKSGPVPLVVLEERVNAWVDTKRG